MCLFFLHTSLSFMGLCEIVFKTGRNSTHADLTSFIPIHKVVCMLNEAQTKILLRVYALTGCGSCCAPWSTDYGYLIDTE